jgi:radical SAM protein with 4Fe4S-binding SPASM domain
MCGRLDRMANLLLTERCVRACPYCFAKKQMHEFEGDYLSWCNFLYIIDFIEISHENHISLLGGEPALHPDFVDFIVYCLERNFHVQVFTSGIWPEKVLAKAAKLLTYRNPDALSFTVNVNQPEISTKKEMDDVDKFLKVFGPFASLGFNIYTPKFSLDFIFQLMNQHGTRRNLRLGLAHPIPGEHNIYLSINDMHAMVQRLIGNFTMFERLDITPGFDCGMPMCLFTDEDLGRLYKMSGSEKKFGCGPAIDIGPDMTVWSCFPLSNFHKKSLYDFNSLQDIMKYFEELHNRVRDEIGGIFDNCDMCAYRERHICRGGCLAHSIASIRNEEPVRLKEFYI